MPVQMRREEVVVVVVEAEEVGVKRAGLSREEVKVGAMAYSLYPSSASEMAAGAAVVEAEAADQRQRMTAPATTSTRASA